MSLDDAQIMRLVQNGQLEPFEELVRRYRAPLQRVAASKLGDATAAEDVVQETFLAVFAACDTYNPAFSFRTWLWTILLNLCKRQLKRRSQQPQVLTPHADFNSATVGLSEPRHQETGLVRAILHERNTRLHELLQTLTEVQSDAVRLRFFGGLKFQEIAEAMGCSLIAAKMRVKNGLLKLAETLRKEEGASP